MSEMFNPHAPATAYYHDATIVAVLELSGKSWLLGSGARPVATREANLCSARRRGGGASARAGEGAIGEGEL